MAFTSSSRRSYPKDCDICLQPLNYSHSSTRRLSSASGELPTLLACGHILGQHCIDTWLHDHPTCPLCRRKLTYTDDCRHIIRPRLLLSPDCPQPVSEEDMPAECSTCEAKERSLVAARYRTNLAHVEHFTQRYLRARENLDRLRAANPGDSFQNVNHIYKIIEAEKEVQNIESQIAYWTRRTQEDKEEVDYLGERARRLMLERANRPSW